MVKQANNQYKGHSLQKKSNLRESYKQFLTNYDHQVVKTRFDETFHPKKFGDQDLFRANRTLPKLQTEAVAKRESNKYYSKKILLNDAVFVCQTKQLRKQIFLKEYLSEQRQADNNDIKKQRFERINIPQIKTSKERSILSERNRKILQLYKKVENNNEGKESPIKISFIHPYSNNKEVFKSKLAEKQQQSDQLNNQIQFDNQSLYLKPSDKKIIQILKQAKQKRNKLQFPKMKNNRSKSSFIVLKGKATQSKSIKNIETESNNTKKTQSQSPLLQTQKDNNDKNKRRNKTLVKLYTSNQVGMIKSRKKKTIWKNQELNLLPINKEQLYTLLRAYAGINTIQQISSGFYRAYIGYGNNYQIVKKTLKERGYWTIVDSLDDDPHFVWTQFKVNKFSENLKQSLNNLYSSGLVTTADNIDKQQQEQLKQFQQIKNNEFLLGCKKLLQRQSYIKLASNIKQKLLASAPLQNLRKLKYQALQVLPKNKYQLDNEEVQKANYLKLHNHIDGAGTIGDKKGLFHYLSKYAELYDQPLNKLIPQTLHVDSQNFDPKQIFDLIPQGPWIVKPGQQTNRGRGITIHITKQDLLAELSKKKYHKNPELKYTNIIQKYIFPLLYYNRKFDIRIWILWNGTSKQAWWYQQGYLRTSSKQFTLRSTNKYIHLTNDAIQSLSEDFGKYQPANKLSFNQFNKYLEAYYGYKGFYEVILQQMKKTAIKVFKMGNLMFNPKQKQHTFQLFGFDYLIDNKFKPWLIQCNTNPCLQINCSLLTRLVPNMLDNLMTITVDTFFPTPTKKKAKQSLSWHHEGFKFELLYDGKQDLETRQKILTHPDFNISYSGQYEQSQQI